MIEDLNILLITGGFNVCDSTWNKAQTEIDKCYKLYLPSRGSGQVVLDGADLKIRTGEIYLFSGYHLDRQYCEDELDVYWLHLIADLLQHAQLEHDNERQLSIDKLQPSLDFIDSNIYKPISLDEIASKSNLSPNYYHRQFKELFHVTPLEYITERRISAARQMLSTTNLSIKEIAYRLGYSNEYYFSRLFKRELDMSPSEFRKSGSSL